MSDLAKREVRGPVKSVETSHATWEPTTKAWTETSASDVAWFRPDGKLSKTEYRNPDGSVVVKEWRYDDSGRVTDVRCGMRNETSSEARYIYDERGRHIRTVVVQADGSALDSEVYSYDEAGRKTRTKYLSNPQGKVFHHIEGANGAVTAPGATAILTRYDDDLSSEIRFLNEDGKVLTHVTLLRDAAGRLLKEEVSMDGGLSFNGSYTDEHQKALQAAMSQIFANTFSSTTYSYDDRGRLVERNHRMGTLGEDRTTYRYEDRDDPVEEVTEHGSREASMNDEDGTLSYVLKNSDVQHIRFEYVYDAHRNWTSKTVWLRSGSDSEFHPVNISRREIDYYAA